MNKWRQARDLLLKFSSGEISAEKFAIDYFELTDGSFSVRNYIKDEALAETVSSVRTACAQFQPDPELYADLMKSAAYPDEFLNQEGLKKRVENTVAKLREAGV